MLLQNVCFLVLFVGYLYAEETVIEISDGKIRGRTETTIGGVTFYSFQGIPYAKPPINELRFQAPQPAEPWDDILDATTEANICFQTNEDRADETEDCLFVNVFTPREPSPDGELLPSMVYIYGGGFVAGAPEYIYYGPHHLMEHGVILVTLNYRVGPFGFFSTGDSAIPGNAGLKDQNLALQWIQKNIQYFGGDPDKVTVFGESAGSASVGYQLLSPKSKGLFRAAILESGSALSPWAFQKNQVQYTYQTAAYINPAFSNGAGSTSELLEFLLSVPAVEIDNASYSLYITENVEYIQIQKGFFYAPVIEHDHEDAFISKKMYETLKEGDINKVPIIIGANSEEAFGFKDDEESFRGEARVFDAEHSLLVPPDMNIADEDSAQKTAEEIKQLYVKDGTFEADPITLVKYFTDQCFVRSIIKHAELQSAFTDVYYYQFSYSGIIGGQATEPVAGFSDHVRHGEELSYLFRHNYGGFNTTDLTQFPESDQLVFNRFITMFTNFAKYLNPTPEEDELLENIIWPTVDADNFYYLDIGSYSEVKLNPRSDTYGSWVNIYDEYGVPPYDTY